MTTDEVLKMAEYRLKGFADIRTLTGDDRLISDLRWAVWHEREQADQAARHLGDVYEEKSRLSLEFWNLRAKVGRMIARLKEAGIDPDSIEESRDGR